MILKMSSILLFLAAVACGCSNESEASAPEPVDDRPVFISTYEAKSHNFHRTIEMSANILANKQVTVLSKLPGEVKKVFVSEGDTVRKGDIIVKLDKRDFRLSLRQAQAQLSVAKAGVAAAQTSLGTINSKHKRLTMLRDKQVISESAYEDIEGGQKSTQAQVTVAQAQLQLAKVGVDAARSNLEYTEIRAPFDGVIAKRMVDEGARLNAMPPTPVAIVVDSTQVKVVGSVPERDLPFVVVENPAEVSIDAIAGDPIKSTITSVDPLVDPTSRTAGVQVLLNNKDGQLHPGMSARITLDLGARNSIGVPDDVVLRSGVQKNTGVIFVVVNGKAVRREVRLGIREGDLREITDGLSAGETVVRGGQERLVDGQIVTVDKKQEAAR